MKQIVKKILTNDFVFGGLIFFFTITILIMFLPNEIPVETKIEQLEKRIEILETLTTK